MRDGPPADTRRAALADDAAMSGDSAASALLAVGALGASSGAWPDELWAGSIAMVDAVLRSFYGVHEFTDDPACVFRLGRSHARSAVALSDGIQIATGEPIGTLHFWNEHLPRYPDTGPDLRWACTMRDQVAHSMRLLADHIETEPAWRDIRALYGDAVFFSARLGMPQIERVCMRFGFERVPTESDPSLWRRFGLFCESLTLWGLTRAFQPAALPRRPFLRPQQELWISRARLLVYARRHAAVAAKAARAPAL